MDYLLISIAVICIGINFVINKVYQKKYVSNNKSLFIYPMICGIISSLIFMMVNGFVFNITKYGIVMSFIYSALILSYTIIGFIAVKFGKLSLYTMFLMIGGMLLPYFYGVIFLNETLNVYRIVGIIILIASLIINSLVINDDNEKNKPIFWVLCVLAFILNGCVSITSKVHQININAMPTNEFVIFQSSFSAVLSLFVILIIPKSKKEITNVKNTEQNILSINILLKISFLALCTSAMQGLSSYLMLEVAKTLPATVQYPFVTGGVTIITALLARIVFKEKITKLSTVCFSAMLIGTILFVF